MYRGSEAGESTQRSGDCVQCAKFGASLEALQGLQGQAERHLGFILRPVGSPGEHYR